MSTACDQCNRLEEYYRIQINDRILTLAPVGATLLLSTIPTWQAGGSDRELWTLVYENSASGRLWYNLVNKEQGVLSQSVFNAAPPPAHISFGYNLGPSDRGAPRIGLLRDSSGQVADQIPYITFGANYNLSSPMQVSGPNQFGQPLPELYVRATGGGEDQPATFRFADPCLGCTAQVRRQQCLLGCCRNQRNFDSTCLAFLQSSLRDNRTDVANQLMSGVCNGKRLNTTECLIYCDESNLVPGTTGRCGIELRQHCSRPENYNDPACGCFLPESVYESYIQKIIEAVPEQYRAAFGAQLRASQDNPACFYPRCQRGALKGRPCTQNVNIQTCFQGIEVSAGPNGVVVGGNINIDNRCIFGPDGEIQPPPPALPPVDPPDNNNTGDNGNNNNPNVSSKKSPLYIIIPIIIIVIVGLILVFVLRR